ncbi:lytic polysaccharide monooxygenase [Amniculicola lignicola CBS 123094]|uniref:lytic cellulose monooxygenase (C4-dehydrogenating) n=1 Tax=Amniculicola lignicola CBS 123094 TaxID=1392246 RepID=A0A6A5WDU3_9PLEO|nr:lytic polysaccharide monooxygenase [Amniculicola lignicola CBS 123094]
MTPQLTLTVILLLYVTNTLAHWNYDRLIVNGQPIGSSYQYVRQTNNSNSPLQQVNSTDMRCNSGAASGTSLGTQTYTVKAGDELGFAVKSTFGHPGPQQVYLSRAPGSAAGYDGSGDWARIYSLTTSSNASAGASDGVLKWATHKAQTFRFNLPAETPSGEYLLRAEGLALHAAQKVNGAQFYIACAQIKVIGKGSEVVGPMVRFPGVYEWDTPGVLISGFWSKIENYTAPGPKMWPEGREEEHVLVGDRKQ